MAKPWTAKRAARCRRRPDGTFKVWTGGRKLKDLPKQQNNFHGIAVHIGKEYKRQNGRIAKIGDMVRFKTKDGTFHKQAWWYVRTEHGWRKATWTTKPTAAQVKDLMSRSRKGRK